MKKKTLILLLVTILIVAATVPLMACTEKGSYFAPTPTPTTPTPIVATPTPAPVDQWNADANENGISDYNEMYIYPDYFGHNASDAQNFIDMLPNVTANYIYWDTGGRTNNNFKRIVDISLNDPLVKWYANHTSIVWLGTSGRLNIDGEPFFLNYTQNAVPVGALMTPAYYFTHGKVGNCAQIATVAYVVMKLKGFQCVEVYGTLNGEDHDWVEAKIAGTIYVINFDGVTPAKELYSSHPEWVPEKRFTEENPYVDCGPME